MAILIQNSVIYTGNGVVSGQSVCIENGRICEMTQDADRINAFIAKHKADLDTIDGTGKLLMPGFVNTHTHSPMTVLRNIGSDLPLDKWLFGEIVPREGKLTPRDIYYGSLLGQIEMLRSGTVCFYDMYEPFEAVAEAISASHMKAVLSVASLHNDWRSGVRKTEKKFAEAQKLIHKWQGACNGRLRVNCEIHSVYLYDFQLLEDVVSLAKDERIGIHMHLHETEKEIEDCIRETGMRPVEFFDSIGAFGVPVTAAHCTHLEERDFDILKEHNVFVSVNLTSNLKLASGIPPLPKLLAKQIPFGFGTDGCASNNNLNLFEELHLAGILYKGLSGDPSLVSPKQVIRAGTLGGEIREGAEADLILIDCTAPHLNPVNDYDSAIVYSMQSSDVDTVIVQGEILMKNREILHIDEEKTIYEVNHVKF